MASAALQTCLAATVCLEPRPAGQRDRSCRLVGTSVADSALLLPSLPLCAGAIATRNLRPHQRICIGGLLGSADRRSDIFRLENGVGASHMGVGWLLAGRGLCAGVVTDADAQRYGRRDRPLISVLTASGRDRLGLAFSLGGLVVSRLGNSGVGLYGFALRYLSAKGTWRVAWRCKG